MLRAQTTARKPSSAKSMTTTTTSAQPAHHDLLRALRRHGHGPHRDRHAFAEKAWPHALELQCPVGKIFILDGKFGWFYTPGDNQAARIPAKKLDDLRSPLRFPSRPYPASKELDNLAVVPDGSDFRISGIPKGMAQRVKLLSLTVSPTGSIEKMRLEEVDGSITEFTFTAMRESVSIPDSTFTFTAPAGVAVVDGLPPI
jgi:hypothetical protein